MEGQQKCLATNPSFCFLGPGPESLRTGKEGQGLLGPRPSLAGIPRARHTLAGRTLPGPGLRRRPRPRWEFEQDRASGKQMPGRWARPDTHLASQEIHCQEGQAKNSAFHVAPGSSQESSHLAASFLVGRHSQAFYWPLFAGDLAGAFQLVVSLLRRYASSTTCK